MLLQRSATSEMIVKIYLYPVSCLAEQVDSSVLKSDSVKSIDSSPIALKKYFPLI